MKLRMSHVIHPIFVTVLLLTLSGCVNRIKNVSNYYFNQGESVSKLSAKTDAYVKTLRLYDQFTTLGIFDVMWLSDGIRRMYVHAYEAKYNLSKQNVERMLDEQLKLNANHISFYLLASQGHDRKVKIFSQDEDDDATWSVYLTIGHKQYHPATIKKVDLPVEYRTLFGGRFNRYQKHYLVTFALPLARTSLAKNQGKLQLTLSTEKQKGTIDFKQK